MFSGSDSAYQSVGFGATTDGVYMPGVGGTGGIALTSAWGIRGAFNHNWDPYWSSSLFGSYSAVRYDGGANDNLLGAGTTSAKGAYCAAFAASHPGESCLLVGARSVSLRFAPHHRARRYVLRLCPDGAARVTIPRGGSVAAGRRFAERNLAWLE